MRDFQNSIWLSCIRACWPGAWVLMGMVGLLPWSLCSAAGPETAGLASANHCEVQAVQNLCYFTVQGDESRYRHLLDIYRPKGKGRCPVLFFLHGGSWITGTKDNYFRIYGFGTVARCLAEHGLVVVLPNYRLSPGVKHPEHIKDVARAFAWTCRNVQRYGGDPQQIFVGGHSAGGHLAALLATDDSYLKEVGRSRQDICGVIGVSGVYCVDHLDFKVDLPGPGGVLRTNLRPFSFVFGDDPKVARAASPRAHVQPGLPPFLIVDAQFDLPLLPDMAKEFAAALRASGCEVQTKTMPWRTHDTVIFDIPRLSADQETMNLMVEFINHCKSRPIPLSEAK